MSEHKWCDNHIKLIGEPINGECSCCFCCPNAGCTVETVPPVHVHSFSVLIEWEYGYSPNYDMKTLWGKQASATTFQPVAKRVTKLACSVGECLEVREVK